MAEQLGRRALSTSVLTPKLGDQTARWRSPLESITYLFYSRMPEQTPLVRTTDGGFLCQLPSGKRVMSGGTICPYCDELEKVDFLSHFHSSEECCEAFHEDLVEANSAMVAAFKASGRPLSDFPAYCFGRAAGVSATRLDKSLAYEEEEGAYIHPCAKTVQGLGNVHKHKCRKGSPTCAMVLGDLFGMRVAAPTEDNWRKWSPKRLQAILKEYLRTGGSVPYFGQVRRAPRMAGPPPRGEDLSIMDIRNLNKKGAHATIDRIGATTLGLKDFPPIAKPKSAFERYKELSGSPYSGYRPSGPYDD